MALSRFDCNAFGKSMCILLTASILFLVVLVPDSAMAADAVYGLNTAHPELIWMLPFIGILPPITLMSLLAINCWIKYFWKVSLSWTFVFLALLSVLGSLNWTPDKFIHILLLGYILFMILMFWFLAVFSWKKSKRLASVLWEMVICFQPTSSALR